MSILALISITAAIFSSEYSNKLEITTYFKKIISLDHPIIDVLMVSYPVTKVKIDKFTKDITKQLPVNTNIDLFISHAILLFPHPTFRIIAGNGDVKDLVKDILPFTKIAKLNKHDLLKFSSSKLTKTTNDHPSFKTLRSRLTDVLTAKHSIKINAFLDQYFNISKKHLDIKLLLYQITFKQEFDRLIIFLKKNFTRASFRKFLLTNINRITQNDFFNLTTKLITSSVNMLSKDEEQIQHIYSLSIYLTYRLGNSDQLTLFLDKLGSKTKQLSLTTATSQINELSNYLDLFLDKNQKVQFWPEFLDSNLEISFLNDILKNNDYLQIFKNVFSKPSQKIVIPMIEIYQDIHSISKDLLTHLHHIEITQNSIQILKSISYQLDHLKTTARSAFLKLLKTATTLEDLDAIHMKAVNAVLDRLIKTCTENLSTLYLI